MDTPHCHSLEEDSPMLLGPSSDPNRKGSKTICPGQPEWWVRVRACWRRRALLVWLQREVAGRFCTGRSQELKGLGLQRG